MDFRGRLESALQVDADADLSVIRRKHMSVCCESDGLSVNLGGTAGVVLLSQCGAGAFFIPVPSYLTGRIIRRRMLSFLERSTRS